MNLPELEGKTAEDITYLSHRTWQNQTVTYLETSSLLDSCKVEVLEYSMHATKGEKSSTVFDSCESCDLQSQLTWQYMFTNVIMA